MTGAKTVAGRTSRHFSSSGQCWPYAQRLESHLLLRIASLPLPATPQPTPKASLEKAVQDYLSAEVVLSQCAARLVEALYRAVPNAPRKRARALLLELKRRARRCDNIILSECVLPPEVGSLAQEYTQTQSCLDVTKTKLLQTYQAAAVTEREMLKDVFRSSQDLRNGIALASPQYFRAVDRAVSNNVRIGQRKLDKTLRSLLRYYLRASTKAAPFSTFCLVAYAEIAGARAGTPVSGQSPVRTLRVNKLLLRPIVALMRHDVNAG